VFAHHALRKLQRRKGQTLLIPTPSKIALHCTCVRAKCLWLGSCVCTHVLHKPQRRKDWRCAFQTPPILHCTAHSRARWGYILHFTHSLVNKLQRRKGPTLRILTPSKFIHRTHACARFSSCIMITAPYLSLSTGMGPNCFFFIHPLLLQSIWIT